MKSTARMAITLLLLAATGLEADEQPKASTFETRLLGVWNLWSSEPKPQPMSGHLLQIDFRTNSVVWWVIRCDGETTEQTGKYTIETTANIYWRDSLTHIIRIQTPGNQTNTAIHLVGVNIGSDNRVPLTAEVLKFRDAFVSSFVFVRNDGQPKPDGDGKPAP